MARLYSDENFDVRVMTTLKELGHDTLTARDAGRINMKIPDKEVLAFATTEQRAVVTFDRLDYLNLHKANPDHAGIIACTFDSDATGLALRVHDQINLENDELDGKFIRIYRPNK